MADLTLRRYQHAERDAAREESRRGFRVHALVTILVCVGLVALNVLVASELPWAIFPVLGMSIGLYVHWRFGVVDVESTVREHQASIERSAA